MVSENHGQRSDEKIPPELAKRSASLAHDLSNALETIVQANYLISQSGPPENIARWVELIDQASQDAVRINQKSARNPAVAQLIASLEVRSQLQR